MNENTQQKENKNVNKKSLVFQTKKEEHFTIKNTLKNYDDAVNTAESIDYPNRWYLYEIYFDIEKDSHLSSVVKHRKTRISGLQFSLLKSNGKIDNKTNDLFNQSWFSQFLDYTLDSLFWGNSLIEINYNKGIINPILIPRENVIPEFQEIKYSPTSQYGDINYTAPIYNKILIDVNNNNNKRNLGDYLSVSKLVLLKNEVLLNWSQHIELFGQPIRMATTDSEDPLEINQILNYLKDLGRSGYLVKNSQTNVEFVEADGKASSSSMYNDFEKFVNDEISKKILGGTMLTDDGSSRSQSEVHERNSYLYTKSDIMFIESIINNKLIPVLKNLGLINTKGIEFSFNEPEIQSVEEKLEIDRFLMDNFKVQDISYFEKRYGLSLEFLPEGFRDENLNQLKEQMSFAKGNNRYDINLSLEDE